MAPSSGVGMMERRGVPAMMTTARRAGRRSWGSHRAQRDMRRESHRHFVCSAIVLTAALASSAACDGAGGTIAPPYGVTADAVGVDGTPSGDASAFDTGPRVKVVDIFAPERGDLASAVIDGVNRKLLVASANNANAAKPSLFRCELDG